MSKPMKIFVAESEDHVSGTLVMPNDSTCLLVLGHGAGAGMHHPFMESIAAKLSDVGVATLRYQFPYMEKDRRRPDSRATLLATVRAAVKVANDQAGPLPLFAGGKSMGGRMTSLAASEAVLPGVQGIVFVGFPLHPVGKPSTSRGDHLDAIALPILFLQGTRDRLADLDLLRPVCDRLGERATLHIVDKADHSFHVLKRSGRTDDEVLKELAEQIRAWST